MGSSVQASPPGLGAGEPQEAGSACFPLGSGLELPLGATYLIEVSHILTVL